MWGLECLCTLGRFGSQLFRKETPMLTGKRPPKLPLIAAAALVAAAGVLCFPLLHANSLNAITPMPLVQASGPQSDLLPQPLLDASFSGFSLARRRAYLPLQLRTAV